VDENKKIKLKKIGYQIFPCCGGCQHGDLIAGMPWGTCKKFAYDHLKHTGEERQVSIHRHGVCEHFEESEIEKEYLGEYAEFCE
jgi:hypothetical protein